MGIALAQKHLGFFHDVFLESNPIPLKYAMRRLGIPGGYPRFPLDDVSDGLMKVLDDDLLSLNLM